MAERDSPTDETRGQAMPNKPLEQPLSCWQLVIGNNTIDVVAWLGGWIYDRAAAGWRVQVAVEERTDPRPLQILGADVIDDEGQSALQQAEPLRLAVVADIGLLQRDVRVQQLARRAVQTSCGEVLTWGEDCGKSLLPRHATEHHLSRAAKVFKAQALMAAAVPIAVAPTESLYRTSYGGRPRRRPLLRDDSEPCAVEF
jgi:hypothetical protein